MKGISSHTGRLGFSIYEIVIYIFSAQRFCKCHSTYFLSTRKYKMKNSRLCIATAFFLAEPVRDTGFRSIRAAVDKLVEAYLFPSVTRLFGRLCRP